MPVRSGIQFKIRQLGGAAAAAPAGSFVENFAAPWSNVADLTYTDSFTDNFGSSSGTWADIASWDNVTAGSPGAHLINTTTYVSSPNSHEIGPSVNDAEYYIFNTTTVRTFLRNTATYTNVRIKAAIYSNTYNASANDGSGVMLMVRQQTSAANADGYYLRIKKDNSAAGYSLTLTKIISGTASLLGIAYGVARDNGVSEGGWTNWRLTVGTDANGDVVLVAEVESTGGWKEVLVHIDQSATKITGAGYVGFGGYKRTPGATTTAYIDDIDVDTVSAGTIQATANWVTTVGTGTNRAFCYTVSENESATNDRALNHIGTGGAYDTQDFVRYRYAGDTAITDVDISAEMQFGASSFDTSGAWLALEGRIQSAAHTADCYQAAIRTNNSTGGYEVSLARIVSGVRTSLVSDNDQAPVTGAKSDVQRWRLTVSGTGATVTVELDGWDGGTWVNVLTYADSDAARIVAAGRVGFAARGRAQTSTCPTIAYAYWLTEVEIA